MGVKPWMGSFLSSLKGMECLVYFKEGVGLVSFYRFEGLLVIVW